MDSPENYKATTTTTTSPLSDAVATQDYGIFSYINNLSPVHPLKAAPEVLGFPGLNSPPPVFTSPHIKTHRETHSFKRSQCPQLPTADLSQQGARGEEIDVVSDQYQIPKTQVTSALFPYSKKECDNKVSSPSGGVDEYLAPLADPMEVDCTYSAHSARLSLMHSEVLPQSLTDSTEPNSLEQILDNENNTGQVAKKALGAFQATLEQATEELQGKSSFEDNPIQIYKQHYGMHRRCLQFGESPLDTAANSPGFWSTTLPANPGDSEVAESACLDVIASSCDRQLISPNQPTIPISSRRNSGNSSSTVPKPSGIGLHLNNIINAMPHGCGTTGRMKSAEKGYLNIGRRKLVSITGCHQTEITTNTLGLSNVRKKASTSSEDGGHLNESSMATGSLASVSPHIVKSLFVPVLLEPLEYQRTSHDKRSISEHADADEESNTSNIKKKRRKASSANDDDGCKRCNCKKTKCLKLYCDCFAAGIYCAEPCACQGCFNRPEYEDTVSESRQQTESRNPLAFTPKIVQHLTESLASSNVEDGAASTPSSARHKRGCNCKKSMCSKKYCECFQANVGCSNGCRCEGCENIYGRKKDYGMIADVLRKELNSSFEKKLAMFTSQDGLLQTELYNHHNMAPLTPSFQFSDHRKVASKSRFFSRRCLPSPDSNLTFLPPYGKSPVSENSRRHGFLMKDWENIEGISSHQELDYCNVDAMDEFSVGYDGPLNSCDLSTLPNPSLSVDSLSWHHAAITPVAQYSGTQHIRALDSDEKFHDVLEDDMPDILKDDSTLLKACKVISPNKKRVSPPRSSLNELGPSSSVDLRSGRKFILQDVPSFPPLTPCIGSKDSSSQNTDDPQDCSCKK